MNETLVENERDHVFRWRLERFADITGDEEIAFALAESEVATVQAVARAIERGATLDQVVRIFV